MVIPSALPAKCSVFLCQDIPFLSKFPAHCATRVDYHKTLPSTSRTIRGTKIKYSSRSHFSTRLVMFAAKNDQLRFDDEFPQEPFWLSLIADIIWGVKSLFAFLVEQPSQLKYIEWPSFSNTVRTATLTLVLVALLIVALASVDSALCYLLALVLRKAS
ncbi:uncharacterized protein LOC129301619 [Prosopis cineraria]|uniref:uncharacterized protein LOC129301619 n=1 Tax=Prosopis cineraria TaxID=364024 RepID=UPI00240F9A3F|nr:uncharacterized protein LOC129301619 [Prosopis cineraria]XP_054796150.1 uncharacterized protein LOC129301619 [Prosopis cineraria]XP_054796151.1 uncharacterized protein LOC129301619 [Prosopis cineraria]